MSILSTIVHTTQAITELARGDSFLQPIMMPVSTTLTLPMLFSGFPQLTLILSSILFSVIAFSRYSFPDPEVFASVDHDTRPSSSSPAIRALAKFLIPTCSIWSKAYQDLAHLAEQQSGGRCINLKLETLIRDIRQGIIELRAPSNDLPRLIGGQLKLDGWHFKLDLSLRDKARTWAWAILDEFTILPDEAFPKPLTFADENKLPSPKLTVLRQYCSLFFDNIGDVIIWPSLDTIPRALVPNLIRTTQKRLQEEHLRLRTRKPSVFSFTTSETALSIFDDAFVYAALPFSHIFSKRLGSTSEDSTMKGRKKEELGLVPTPRSSAPLFTRLPDILSLLTSGPDALRVLSLSNCSASYGNALDVYATSLEYDGSVRRECIKSLGIQGWREERMYARWEAALLRAGLLTRWVVLLEVKD